MLPPLLAGLPFYGAKNLVPSLIDKYITTASGYQYATINAFNWFAALGGNWQALDACPVFNLSWKVLGIFNIAVITVLLVVLAVISWRAGRFSPLLLAAFYTVGIFTFAHCMHERYLVLGMLLVLLAAARWNDIRLYGAGFGLSITGFLNLETVYTLVAAMTSGSAAIPAASLHGSRLCRNGSLCAAGFHRVGHLPPWSDFSTGKSGNHRKR